jgi:transposase
MQDQPVRQAYPKDVSDEEWMFVAPYLCLLPEDCGQRKYPLREVFNALRYAVWAGCPWRGLPHDLPPWEIVYQQGQRWIKAGVFEALCHDLRVLVRLTQGREPQPSAAIFDGRTVQSSPESGARAGYDGHKKKNGSKTHVAVDTLGHLLALHVTAANAQERAQVGTLAEAVQEVTGQSVQLAWGDQGYTGEQATQGAAAHGIDLQVVKLNKAKRGFVLLPRRWVVERTFGWIARCRRLARDYERLPQTFAGLHWLMFSGLLLARLHFHSFVSS